MAKNHSTRSPSVAVHDSRPIAEIQAAVSLASGVDHTGDEYEEAQKAVRRLLTDLVERGEHTVDLRLRFRIRAGKRAGVSLVRRVESLRDDRIYDVISALIRAGTDRIQVCRAPVAGGDEECGRLFVRVTRKKFCSTRCQVRAFMRTWPGPKAKKGARRGKTTRKG